MELILKEDVENLGARGELVDVKPGYARNYLIPKNLAIVATKASRRILEEEKRQREVRERKLKRDLQETAETLKNVSVTIVVQAGEEDQLYGSVSERDIAEAITTESRVDITPRQVELEKPIKVLGVYTVTVKLHSEVEAPVKVWVVKE
ncbi:MAG: 50S ribosomal protein L9 [Candidatus Latescibacteria bacterium]|nr:50S ribosomal protein L9 [bacterium]MBD3425241.1 50S ribosomal protein L9 [Candidatus Latescibacterota bacterium]